MSEFGWNKDGDADAIVLGWQPRTAVYASRDGVVIRQEGSDYDDRGDDTICLTPLGALQIAWKVIEVAHGFAFPKPDRKLMAKPVDLGPAAPSSPLPIANEDQDDRPLLRVMQEAAE